MTRDVAVLGAGAVGSVLGARLHRAGRDVLLVGRGPHVDAIRADGLLLRERGGDGASGTRLEVDASTRLDPADVVLITVRTPDVEAAARQVARDAPEATVVTLQNGVRADDLAAGVLGRDAVVGGVVVLDAEFLEPGEVTLNREGPVLVGDPWGREATRVPDVADLLAEGVPVEVRTDLRGARWMKLLVNLNNALPAATGRSVQEVLEDLELARVAARAMREGLAVVRAAGEPLASIPWASRPLVRAMGVVPLGIATRVLRWKARRTLGDVPARPSTLQGLLRDGAPEVRFLNGEIVRTARRVGTDAPVNGALVDLVEEVREKGRFRTRAEVLDRTP